LYNDYTYLYIEDDPLSRDVMRLIMENAMGIETLTMFENSADFAERIQALPQQPDLILLDIHLKPHDGFAILGTLRSLPEYAETKIVAVTASVMNEEVERLRTSGFNGAIAKPLSVQTFPDLIERILHGETIWHIA
jgi:CheY-like chemotaxis protein